MTTANMNACLAEYTPDEIRLGPRLVNTWLRAGTMTEAEAGEWLVRIDAWRAFYELELGSFPLHWRSASRVDFGDNNSCGADPTRQEVQR